MIELQHLTKRFTSQSGTLVALQDISLTIPDGDVYGIIGMSGAGKSTLVRCINMLERPDEGRVLVNGRAMQDLDAKALRAARQEIAMIFQHSLSRLFQQCVPNPLKQDIVFDDIILQKNVFFRISDVFDQGIEFIVSIRKDLDLIVFRKHRAAALQIEIHQIRKAGQFRIFLLHPPAANAVLLPAHRIADLILDSLDLEHPALMHIRSRQQIQQKSEAGQGV